MPMGSADVGGGGGGGGGGDCGGGGGESSRVDARLKTKTKWPIYLHADRIK